MPKTFSKIEEGKMENLYFNKKGEIIKRRGWKTLRGAYNELRRINKSCKKKKYSTMITIQLPLKT